jgi:1-acyl-sn-glycerol-3-phosphate acyltransferase
VSAYGFWKFVAKVLLKPPFWVTVEGAELIPKTGPVVLVPNHVSFLDPPFVGISCPRPIRFMARSSLANSRALGWWMRQVGVVLIDRDAPARTTFGESVKILDAGSVMAVFAEGTRSRDGRLAEFKKGVLKLLDKTGAIAVPTGIIGGFEAWPRHRKLPRPHRCRVRFGSPLTAAEVCAPGGLERLRAAVAALSGQELAPIGETPAAANGGPAVSSSLNADSSPADSQRAEPPSRGNASTG